MMIPFSSFRRTDSRLLSGGAVILSLVFAFFLPQVLLAADTGWTSGVIEYVDDQKELKVLDPQGKAMDNVYLGMELLGGDTVVTGNTTVELRLLPGGSLIKVSPNTTFKINTLPGPKAKNNDFSLVKGKIRVLAQKTKDSSYTFHTPVAVAGVRGTEFGLEVDNAGKDLLLVKEGLVEYTQILTRTTVQVATSQVANAAEPVMVVKTLETPAVEAFFVKEDLEVAKRLEEQALAEAAAAAKEAALKLSAEEERKKADAEEAARLAEIRKQGEAAIAAEARRQKERDEVAREAALADAQAKADAERLKTEYLKGMIYVEGGTFKLGDTQGRGRKNETPVLTQSTGDFYLGQNVVNVGEFKRFVHETGYRTTAELRHSANTVEGGFFASRQARSWKFPGYSPSALDPVRCLTWYDAVAYCNWLSVSMGKKPVYLYPGFGTDIQNWPAGWNNRSEAVIELDPEGNGFRLPTEIEWEYAAKGGKAQLAKGTDKNPLGFSRMLRVGEWMQDIYTEYGSSTQGRQNRVTRGLPATGRDVVFSASTRDASEPTFAADFICFRVCLPKY